MAAVIDVCAWTGSWGTFPVRGAPAQVRDSLRRLGVQRICLSPLDAVWQHNPHRANVAVYAAAERWSDVDPVPVVDPTIPTWPDEVLRAVEARARLVRLLPAYGGYALTAADDLLAELARARLVACVQVRMEDVRCQHPRAVVDDVPLAEAVDASRRHPDLALIIAGAPGRQLLAAAESLLCLPRVWADVSQVDGMDGVRLLVEEGLGERLLYGSHAPLFVPQAGLARVLADLDDAPAADILGGNAGRLLEAA